MRIAWAVLLVAVVVLVAGCDDELKGTFGPPQPPTPVVLKATPQKAQPVAAVGAPAPVVKPAGLTREDVRKRNRTRSAGWCATGDEWMFWIDEPRSADELSMLQEWALDHAAPDRRVAIGALSAQKNSALADTWRTLLKEPAMVKADLFTIAQGLLANGSEADVPLVLGVLKESGDTHLTRIATEVPPNISAAALHELILADARKQAAEQQEEIRRAEDGHGLADTVVAKVITASQKSLTACAEAAPTESPATRVTLQLTIGTSGAVTHATVNPATYRGTPLEHCLLKIGTGLVFPRADEETEVQVPLRVGRATGP